jgi:aspartyl-tRNA(Asn)/glutamyl-tRNA(Gln) amidotransferase subunit B
MLEAKRISVPAAKEVLAEVVATGAEPEHVVEARGLGRIGDEAELEALAERLVAENPAQAQQLREGKERVIGYFVGQAMKATGGRADPGAVAALVRRRVLGEG